MLSPSSSICRHLRRPIRSSRARRNQPGNPRPVGRVYPSFTTLEFTIIAAKKIMYAGLDKDTWNQLGTFFDHIRQVLADQTIELPLLRTTLLHEPNVFASLCERVSTDSSCLAFVVVTLAVPVSDRDYLGSFFFTVTGSRGD